MDEVTYYVDGVEISKKELEMLIHAKFGTAIQRAKIRRKWLS